MIVAMTNADHDSDEGVDNDDVQDVDNDGDDDDREKFLGLLRWWKLAVHELAMVSSLSEYSDIDLLSTLRKE